MLIHELFYKDPYVVPEEAHKIILDRKPAVCMDKNGKDTKHNRNIAWWVNFVRNDEKFKLENIYCCEGGLQLADIATNNVGDNYSNPRMQYIIVGLENW